MPSPQPPDAILSTSTEQHEFAAEQAAATRWVADDPAGQCSHCAALLRADEHGILIDQTGGDTCTERGDCCQAHDDACGGQDDAHQLAGKPRDPDGHALGCPRDHPERTECPIILGKDPARRDRPHRST